jgi:hypothetical protein
MRRFEAKSARSATYTRSFGDLNLKLLPKRVLMTSSSDLP